MTRNESGQGRGAAVVALAALVAAGCEAPTLHEVSSASPAHPLKHGVLVTYRHGAELGRETWEDNGKVVTTVVRLAGEASTVVVRRKPRWVRVSSSKVSSERPVPSGAVVLANGAWQALAVDAAWFAEAASAAPVKVLVPGREELAEGQITVTTGDEGTRHVVLSYRDTRVEAEVSAEGEVTHVRVPSQDVEVLPEGRAPAAPSPRLPPPGVVAEPYEVRRGEVPLVGEMWRPSNSNGALPLAVIVAGRGPVDRDGNGGVEPVVKADSYRLLAEGLTRAGVAVLRFDKRGVGRSGENFPPEKATLDEYAADVGAFVERARKDPSVAALTLVGHGEGALVASRAAELSQVDALVLLEAAGRALDVLAYDRIAARDAVAARAFAKLIEEVHAGRDPIVPPSLTSTIEPAAFPYWKSVAGVDPPTLLSHTKTPTTVVVGEYDLEASSQDAAALAGARAGVKTVMVPKMSYVLKEEPSRSTPQPGYGDPSRALAPGLIEVVVAGIAKTPTMPPP